MSVFGHWFNQYPSTDFSQINLDWIVREVKKCVEDYVKLNADFADLDQDFDDLNDFVINYFNSLNVQQEIHDEVVAVIQEMVDNGDLNAIIQAAVNVYLTPEMYGAVGDGVTNDYNAFVDMFDAATTKDAIVVIPNKSYRLAGATDIDLSRWIIGKGGTIGYNGFKFVAGDFLDISGLKFITSLGETPLGWSSTGKIGKYENLKFINTGTRNGIAIRCSVDQLIVRDVYVENFEGAVTYNNTSNVSTDSSLMVDGVTAVNCLRGVDIEGTYTATMGESVNNVTVQNVKLINTAAQKATMTTEVGSDAVLISGANNVIVHNIYSTYAKERTCYLNNIHGLQLSDVYTVGSQSVKVAGVNQTGLAVVFSEDVSISNITAMDVGSNAYALMLYDVIDVDVKGVTEINSLADGTDSESAILLSKRCDNVTIDGVELENIGRGAISLLADNSALTNKLKNINIKNVHAKDVTLYTASYSMVRVGTWASNFIDGLILENIVCNPGYAYYVASKMAGFITLNNMENVVIKNCDIRGCSGLYGSLLLDQDITGRNIYVTGYKQFYSGVQSHGYDISKFFELSEIISISYSANSTYNTYSENIVRNMVSQVSERAITHVKLPYARALAPAGVPCTIHAKGPNVASFSWDGTSATLISGSGMALSGAGILTGAAGNYVLETVF